jgi:hypothetical protein
MALPATGRRHAKNRCVMRVRALWRLALAPIRYRYCLPVIRRIRHDPSVKNQTIPELTPFVPDVIV